MTIEILSPIFSALIQTPKKYRPSESATIGTLVFKNPLDFVVTYYLTAVSDEEPLVSDFSCKT